MSTINFTSPGQWQWLITNIRIVQGEIGFRIETKRILYNRLTEKMQGEETDWLPVIGANAELFGSADEVLNPPIVCDRAGITPAEDMNTHIRRWGQ